MPSDAAVRATVVAREDNACRIPWCKSWVGLEWAHLKAKGMGGNPDGSRSTTANTIAACAKCHRGVRSLHSGHLKYRFLSDRGADGPMAFALFEEIGRFKTLAEELQPWQ